MDASLETFSMYNTSQPEELSEMEEEMLEKATPQKEYTVIKLKKEKGTTEYEDELLNLKLELNQAYSDINTLTEQKNVLRQEISNVSSTEIILHTSVTAKEAEIIKLRKELQQAYTEISALRTEKEELQKKLTAADVTQGILQDPGKLHFYTGLNSAKDFHTILSLLADVDSSVKSVSLETQVLIVLTKLKLNLLYTDLAYRFQTSSKTVHRICDIIIPPLESKIDLLVKCPINNALKKNIPVYFKNTAYENLYQRLRRKSKSKTEQSENEDTDTDIM